MEQNQEQVVASEAVKSSVLGSLGIEGKLLAFQFVNFSIVLAVVWFLILKPLVKKLEERRQIIDESLDNAKKVETELHMAEPRARR